jgi:hypothetical protein
MLLKIPFPSDKRGNPEYLSLDAEKATFELLYKASKHRSSLSVFTYNWS